MPKAIGFSRLNLVQSIQEQSQWLKMLMTDPATCLLSEEKLARLSQLDSSKTLARDRLAELAKFYQVSEAEAAHIQGLDELGTAEPPVSDGLTEAEKLEHYRQAQKTFVARLMLRQSRFGETSRLIQFLNHHYPAWRRRQVSVLDYGCGVADYGLSFALLGYDVTLCDIAKGNLDFAQWRFLQRSLDCNVIAVTETMVYPPLGCHRLIIATEFLEHLRDPVKALVHMTQALPPGGYLFLTDYPKAPRNIRELSLKDAAILREETLLILQRHFQPIRLRGVSGKLYQKNPTDVTHQP